MIELPDPLGLSSAVKQASAELFQTVAGPLYGFGDRRPGDRVAVVEVSDESVARAGGWPLDRAAYAAWIETILERRPAALMIDIRFMERLGLADAEDGAARSDPTIARFAELAAEAEARNIPIFFARGGVDWLPLPAALDRHAVVTGWTGQHEAYYPLQVVDAPAGAPRAGRPDPEAGEPTRRFGAYEVYARLCAEGRLPSFCAVAPQEAGFRRPMELRWRLFPDPEQQYATAGCRVPLEPAGELGSRLLAVGWSLYKGLVRLGEREPTPCRPVLTLQTHSWNRAFDPPDGQRVWDMLEGRVVFFGVGARDGNDLHAVPGYGRLSGVQVHAQAFENLLRFGNRYVHVWAAAPHFLPFHIEWLQIIEGAVWLAVSIVAVWFGHKWRGPLLRLVAWLRAWGPAAALAGFALATILGLIGSGGSPGQVLLQPLLAGVLVGLGGMLVWLIPLPDEKDGWRGRHAVGLGRDTVALALLAGLAILVNDALSRVAGADWITFLLLYTALRHEIEKVSETHEAKDDGGTEHADTAGSEPAPNASARPSTEAVPG